MTTTPLLMTRTSRFRTRRSKRSAAGIGRPGQGPEDGQALVEFALVLPIIVVILFGIVAFGVALNDWIDETQLASEAARFAAVDSEHGNGTLKEETFKKWIKEQGVSGEFQKNGKVEMCSPTSKAKDYVMVRLTYEYDWFGLANLLGTAAKTPITSTAAMRIEVPPAEAEKYGTEFESSPKACK
jgi:Flp pilus assembly protein TadG